MMEGASSAVGASGVYSEGFDSLVSALASLPKTASKLSCATSQPMLTTIKPTPVAASGSNHARPQSTPPIPAMATSELTRVGSVGVRVGVRVGGGGVKG